MLSFFGPHAKRKKLLQRVKAGSLNDYLCESLPLEDTLLNQASLLAVDLETTGLSARKNEIISFGFVQINCMKIELASARHILVNNSNALPKESVVIHKITDDEMLTGITLQSAMDDFLHCLKGKVLVAHHAKIETDFLNRVCKQIYGSDIILPVIDTLEIELQRLETHLQGNNNLNLSNCCKRYNLPRYKLHDALSDALSCAELLLAQLAYSREIETLKLGKLMKYLPG